MTPEDPRIRPSAHAPSIAQPDVTLLLDDDGVIRDATLYNAISRERFDAWLGRPWAETVGGGGSAHVRQMVQDARHAGVSAFGQVNQRFPSGLEVPIEYTAVRLGGKAGLIAIGRNVLAVAELQARLLAAQHAMERDYWKLRQVETRYRLLFDAASEAVMVIDAETLRVIEANPAAIRAVGLPPGEDLMPQITPAEREPFRAMLARVREQMKAPGQMIHLGPQRVPWMVRAVLMTAEAGPVYLLQFAPMAVGGNGPPPAVVMSTERLVDRLPDGFVVLDRAGTIRRTNRAFLDLVQVGAEGGAIGTPLGRFLSRPGADAGVLMASLRRHGAVRRFVTTLSGDLGRETEVEISAVFDEDEDAHHAGALVRDISRRPEPAARPEPVAELPAGTSLRDVVREAIAVVERRHIEVALARADGNRTIAAELLGLSRQSLYAKLDRYALHDNVAPETDNDG